MENEQELPEYPKEPKGPNGLWNFLKANFFKPSVIIPGIVLLILGASFATGSFIQKRIVLQHRAAEGTVQAVPVNIFSDDFERADFYTLNASPSGWIIYSSLMKKTNFTLVPSGDNQVKVYSGSKMLKVANNNEGLQASVHAFNPALKDAIVRISFYDYNDDRSAGTVVSVSNSAYIQDSSSTSAKAIILQIDHGQTGYTFRNYTESKTYYIGTRSAGWHTVEFRLISCGNAYVSLDGQPYSNYAVANFNDISMLSLGRVWRGYPGNTYFDKLEVTNYFVPASGLTNQQILDSWSDLVYQKYKITGSDPSLFVVPAGEDRGITSNNRFRFLADQAQMLLYYYHSRCEFPSRSGSCDPADLDRAKNIIKAYINNYEDPRGNLRIGQVWLSTVGMNLNLFSVWWAWKDLDVATKQKFFSTIQKEADFWTWALREVQTKPTGTTIPTAAGRGTNNLTIMSAIDSTDLRQNTRGEEISPIGWFLTSAALILPSSQNSKTWEEAGKCFAWHTFSREPGEVYCGVKTMNITSDYLVGNHGQVPSPMYALAGITSLQRGQLGYFLAGKSYPSEFEHNMEKGISSTIWQKNETECGCSDPGCFLINKYCNGGGDWGDNNFLATAMMLGHWEQLGKTSQIKTDAGNLLRQLLERSYFDFKNLYWSKTTSANSDESVPLGPWAIHWMKNMELHTQESAYYWVMSNINNQDFRAKYFPKTLDICEENFLNRKVWAREENFTASCDSSNKKVGSYSLKLDSSRGFSNIDFYTPLINVSPSTQYKLSYWVKTENLVPNSGVQTYGKVFPAFYKSTAKESEPVNAGNRISSGFNMGANLGGTNDWTLKEVTFATTPDTAFVRIRVMPGNEAKGILWIDNVVLEKSTVNPTTTPVTTPTVVPSTGPSITPTKVPTIVPTRVPTATPTSSGISCNTNEVSLSVSPNPARINSSIKFNIAGDASTYITDNYGGGAVSCTGVWNAKTCTASATAGTYTWTHKWKKCVGDFQHCSPECSLSKSYTLTP